MRSPIGTELHHTGRIGWLRAAVLGAKLLVVAPLTGEPSIVH